MRGNAIKHGIGSSVADIARIIGVVVLVVAIGCGPAPRRNTFTCEPDQFLMDTCGDLTCVTLPAVCVEQPTCECLNSNPLCVDEETCTDAQREASASIGFGATCEQRPDGSLVLDVPPIDYC